MTPALCTVDSTQRFATSLLADTDCQAMTMVERGYAALSQPGGTVSVALTGLMILAVAFFGYRLLFGRGLILSDAVSLTVKIGIVLLLATSWASWQAVAYNGFARAPTQIASELLVGIGSPPPIDSLENTLDGLTQAAVGYRSRAGIASPLVGGPAAAAAVLNVSAIILTLSTVGILIASRVVLAILLAIAPAMAGLILFNSTRGMAKGWLAAMAAVAIAPAFALLVASIEFAIITPILQRLLAEQAAGTFENESVMPIGLVAIVFVIALIFAVRAAAQIGRGLIHGGPAEERGPAAETIVERQQLQSDRLLLPAPASVLAVTRALEAVARRESGPSPNRTRLLANAGARSAARDRGSVAPATDRALMTSRSNSPIRPRRHGVGGSRAAVRRDS